MAIFEWVCRECAIYWDRDCPVGKAPNRTKCPKCKKLCDKYWQNANTAISFKDDGCGNANGTGGAMDFHTVKQRYRKFAKEGYDKDSANRFLHRKIKETKERKDNATFYKAMNLDWQKMENDGLAKRLSADESRAKIERARDLTVDAYDKATKMGYRDINQDKLDITKPQKQG
tara:strand:+ start:1478 stop:1996 length:519 start_codon:yes stop_codon:yes gene_type:complete